MRVTVRQILSVSLSVTTLVRASLGFTLRKRYVQHCYRLFSRFSIGNFPFKLWREKANILMSICLPRHHIMLPMQRDFARIRGSTVNLASFPYRFFGGEEMAPLLAHARCSHKNMGIRGRL